MTWIIVHKGNRRRTPYAGPCCYRVGIRPGQRYKSRALAVKDAAKLNKVNIVGFQVIQYQPDSDRPVES